MFGNNNYKNVNEYEKIYKAHGVIRHKTWRPKGCGNGRHALLCGFHESSRWGHLLHKIQSVHRINRSRRSWNSVCKSKGPLLLSIPNTVKNNGVTYTVTVIEDEAYKGCTNIITLPGKGLFIPNGVTTIGKSAFDGCTTLTGKLTIPNSVTTIGDNAFLNCSGLTGDLTIPSGVTTINYSAFAGCKGFNGKLSLPSSLTTIGDNAFLNCSGLTGDLTIPSGVKTIGWAAFAECTGFTGKLTIPNTVTTIGYEAFSGCSGLTGDLIIPNSVTSIGSGAFFNCTGFTGRLQISNSIDFLNSSAFQGCSGLTGDLTIPSGVKEIAPSAFTDCSGFKGKLSLPSSLTTIGDNAFYKCSGLTGDLTIPNGVTTIGESAFRRCSGFTGDLIIPGSVTTISKQAFSVCTGFSGDLNIGNGVTKIGTSAFYNCNGLTGKLTIPNTVTTIGDNAFNNCSNLTGDLIIPNSVTTIGPRAFQNCTGFTGRLQISNSIDILNTKVFFECSGLTGDLTIPNGVKSISSDAFYNCTGMTGRLTIPSSITALESTTFIGANFREILIPNSVISIGSNCFKSALGSAFANSTHVCLPSSLTTLQSVANVEADGNKTMEITIPCQALSNGSSSNNFDGFKAVYYMGTDLANTGNFSSSKNNDHVYVKPSVYEKYKDDATYKDLNLSASIPVTFPAGKEYVTLCRDFDVDLRHANDNLPEGIEPLKAYIVDDANGDLKTVYMDEIKYIPSRLKANVDGYKGMEEYVGVVLKGTPGYTYYYQMGEEDYSKGKDGQMTLEKALALSSTSAKSKRAMRAESSTGEKAMLVGAGQAKEVQQEETSDGVTYKTYGLKDGKFLAYESSGVIPYNKAYLRIPLSKAPSGSNAKVTMYFNNDNGTTDIVQVDLGKDSTLGNTAKDAMYNLQGMRVDDTYHGLVIVNGRKYLKK